MARFEALTFEQHAQIALRPGFGAELGDAVNLALLAWSEIPAAQRDFPVLFGRDPEGSWQPLALLGLAPDQNLFIDKGRWTASMIPAVISRRGFGMAVVDDQPVVQVDRDHPAITASDTPGTLPLFLPHGGYAPVLEAIVGALTVLHHAARSARAASALIEELNLIEPSRIELELDEGRKLNFDGYGVIAAERVAELDGAAFERLNRAGLLTAVIHAGSSLDNLPRLAARHRQQLG